MKNKLIAVLALVVSASAFFVSIAYLVYRIRNDFSYGMVIFQLIATGLIAVLCFFNFIYLFTTSDKKDEDDDN